MEKNVRRKFKFNTKFICNNKPMKTMVDIHMHTNAVCVIAKASFTWGYTHYEAKVLLNLLNLVVCEKILGIIVLMVAIFNVPCPFRHYLGFYYSIYYDFISILVSIYMHCLILFNMQSVFHNKSLDDRILKHCFRDTTEEFTWAAQFILTCWYIHDALCFVSFCFK